MSGTKRREEILNILQNAKQVVNATVLAEKMGVTRQVVVADIALLRASGVPIRAEHRGYIIDREQGLLKSIVCKHDKNQVRDEFYAIVDNGGAVVDVQVEHQIYGQISANLAIASRYDADEFIRETTEAGVSQLSDLTGGVHIHTLRVPSDEAFERICRKLSECGVLVED